MKKILFSLFILLSASAGHAQDSTGTGSEESLKALPVLWMQTAAEYRALCYQAFNIAQLRLEKMLKKKKRREHWAIVTDLDETILDNSYEEAKRIKTNKDFSSADFNNWVNLAAATEVPGASKFLQWAHEQGVSIFYISNRDSTQLMATLANLQKLQLPDADTAHMLFLTNTSSKEARRQKVMASYNIVMLLGDNLNDFTSFFEKKSIDVRKAEVDNVRDEWGNKFIVLPNSTYGEWENAIYNYNRKLTPKEKDALRKNTLKDY